MRYVYALVNQAGQVEYVGETKDLRWRFYDHTSRPTHKFYGRTDLEMLVLSEHETRQESYQAQCWWQEHYGLPTDKSRMNEALAKGRAILKDLGIKPGKKRKGSPK